MFFFSESLCSHFHAVGVSNICQCFTRFPGALQVFSQIHNLVGTPSQNISLRHAIRSYSNDQAYPFMQHRGSPEICSSTFLHLLVFAGLDLSSIFLKRLIVIFMFLNCPDALPGFSSLYSSLQQTSSFGISIGLFMP